MCVGLPGRVVRIVDEEHSLVEVEIGDDVKQVSVGILSSADEEVAEGDWLEIHSGFALAKLDEEEAESMLEHMRWLDQADRTGVDQGPPSESPVDHGERGDAEDEAG